MAAITLLGIDVGTSAVKALVIDQTGAALGKASAPLAISTPRPGFSEQNPADWWSAAGAAAREALGKAGRGAAATPAAAGLTGQMHGSVFLDQGGEVIRPALLWNDQRTAAECEEITRLVGADRLLSIALSPALTGFTAPKILWLRRHEPDAWRRVRRVMLPKDYVRWRLTGEEATDVSDASGTLLLDVRRRRWSAPILEALEIDPRWLPRCVESTAIAGRVTPEVAREWGIAAGTPVVAGAGDQAAGAVGVGAVAAGVVAANLGTSGVMFAPLQTLPDRLDPRLHTFCHAVPGRWHVMGVMLSAGGAFQWYREKIGARLAGRKEETGEDPYDRLRRVAEGAAPGCEGLFFLPYLTGERTPHADPHARGAWIGLTPRHGEAEMIRSLLEGVTYGMRDALELIRGLGLAPAEVRATGGGSRSAWWNQLQADVYGAPVVTVSSDEGPAFGAALLAGVGIGAFGSVEEACRATIRVTGRFEPRPDQARFHAERFAVYQRLYRALRESFADMARLPLFPGA